ncbi:MAG TPA: hypothetical protein VNB22_19320 [Pyrinomonadaceae bacterium]|nr:hypothetical protein [Pyrinomonadaceae bacterium]
MIFYKQFAFLLVVGLFFAAAAAAQTTTPDVKRDGLTPELKENALKLLASVARETQQFNLPENRVRAQTIVADLMWEHDEQSARTMFQYTVGELQNLLAGINLPEGLEMTTGEKAEHYSRRYQLAELRKDLVLTLALRDSQAALTALAALKIRPLEDYDPMDPSELELQITTAIVKKAPDKSYAVAKEQLDANGVTYQFVEALKNLHQEDSGLAANLGRDVLARIKSLKIRVPSADGNTPTANPETEIDFSQVATFISAATEMNRTASRDKARKMLPVLADAEMKALVELIANAFLKTTNPAQYSIGTTMTEISRFAPALAQRIRLKFGAEASKQLDKVIEANSYYYDSKEKNAEELAKLADVSAPDARDYRYSFAALKALEENEPEKAQAIAERIKDRKNYAYLFEQIQAAVPLAKARRGDLEEVRKILATLKTDQERVATLTELASALAAKGEKETAKTLLGESLQMMPGLLRKQTELESVAKVAGVYSRVAPEQAFALVESSIGQMNGYISAGIRMDEFYGGGAVEADELLFNSMNKQVLMSIPNSSVLMKNLGCADFERAVALADKFDRPEIRLFVRLRLVQALLDADAAEKEQNEREQLVTDEET